MSKIHTPRGGTRWEQASLEPLEQRSLLSADLSLPTLFDNGKPVSSVLSADFDIDGIPDMVVAAGRQIAFLRGVGDGSFEPARVLTLNAPAGKISAGHLNADAYLDLVSAGTKATGVLRSVIRVLTFDVDQLRLVPAFAITVDAATTSVEAANLIHGTRDQILFTGRFVDGIDRAQVYHLRLADPPFPSSPPRGLRLMATILEREGRLLAPALINRDQDPQIDSLIYVAAGTDASSIVEVFVTGFSTVSGGVAVRATYAGRLTEPFAADLDNDGDFDIAAASQRYASFLGTLRATSFDVLVFRNDGTGALSAPDIVYEGQDLTLPPQTLDRQGRIVGISADGENGPALLVLDQSSDGDPFNAPGTLPKSRSSIVELTPDGGGGYTPSTSFEWLGESLATPPSAVVPVLVTRLGLDDHTDYAWVIGSRLRVFNYDGNPSPLQLESASFSQRVPAETGRYVTYTAQVFDPSIYVGTPEARPFVDFFLDINGNGVIDAGDIRAVRVPTSLGEDPVSSKHRQVQAFWPRGTFNLLVRATSADGTRLSNTYCIDTPLTIV